MDASISWFFNGLPVKVSISLAGTYDMIQIVCINHFRIKRVVKTQAL
jgi:hypothetical protein